MHSIVTTFRGAVIKVEVANFCAAMDTLIDQDANHHMDTYLGIQSLLQYLTAPLGIILLGMYSTQLKFPPVVKTWGCMFLPSASLTNVINVVLLKNYTDVSVHA